LKDYRFLRFRKKREGVGKTTERVKRSIKCM